MYLSNDVMLCLLIAQLAFSKPNILHVGKTLENKNVCMSETGNKIIVLSCNIRFMIKHSKSKVRGGEVTTKRDFLLPNKIENEYCDMFNFSGSSICTSITQTGAHFFTSPYYIATAR